MAAQVSHHAPSGRFIRAYLLTWGLLAAGGLVYLASLAWTPDLLGPLQRQQVTEPDPSIQAATKALAELGTVRRTVTEIQNDLGRLKSTIDERTAEERAAQARLAALEERVTTLATPPPEPAVMAKPPTDKRKTAAEPHANSHIITIIQSSKAPAAPAGAAQPPKAAVVAAKAPTIETGSIAPGAAHRFRRARSDAGKNRFRRAACCRPIARRAAAELEHATRAARRRARCPAAAFRAARKVDGTGPYRLVAGPLPSRADADKVCTDMGVGRNGCFSTTYIGEPL